MARHNALPDFKVSDPPDLIGRYDLRRHYRCGITEPYDDRIREGDYESLSEFGGRDKVYHLVEMFDILRSSRSFGHVTDDELSKALLSCSDTRPGPWPSYSPQKQADMEEQRSKFPRCYDLITLAEVVRLLGARCHLCANLAYDPAEDAPVWTPADEVPVWTLFKHYEYLCCGLLVDLPRGRPRRSPHPDEEGPPNLCTSCRRRAERLMVRMPGYFIGHPRLLDVAVLRLLQQALRETAKEVRRAA